MDVTGKSFDECLALAKKKVEENYGLQGHTRQWLASHIDSYNDQKNRVTLYALEGSPPKGYILAKRGQMQQQILAMDLNMKKLKEYLF
jgi:hypothetical protein